MKIEIKRNIDLVRLRNLVRSTLTRAYKNASKDYIENFIDLTNITDFRFPDEDSRYSDVYNCILNMYESYKNHNNISIKYATTRQVSLLKETDSLFRLRKTAKAVPIYKYNLGIKSKPIEEYVNKEVFYQLTKNGLYKEYDLTIYDTKVYYVFNLITESNFTCIHLKEYINYINEHQDTRNSMRNKYFFNLMFKKLIHIFINKNLWYCPVRETNTIRCTEYNGINNIIFISNKEYNYIRYVSSFVRAMCESIFFRTKLAYDLPLQTAMQRTIMCDIAAAAILRKFYFPYNPCFFGDTNLKLYLDALKSDELIDRILFLAQDIFNIVFIRLVEISNGAIDILMRHRYANIPENQFPPLMSISNIIGQPPKE